MKAEKPARLLLPTEGADRPRRAAPQRTKQSQSPSDGRLDGAEATLFEALRRHRLAVSREQGLPPYVIASDRTLRELAQMRPRSLDELKRVYGIGETKAGRYGAGFLRVVAVAGEGVDPR